MTMFDLCRSHADRNPEGMAYIWLDEEESVAQSITFRELHESALRVAAALRQRRLVGQCAMLMYRPGLDFIVTLLGCFAAGVIAVPVPAGVPRKRAERWARIAEDCTAKAILAGRQTIAEIGQAFAPYPALNALAVVTTDECCNEPGSARDRALDPITAQSVAFIQYTSGSTGLPKGVLISHGNILANQAMIKEMFGHSEATVFAGWLPFYHDMGLIGNVFQPLYLGVKSVLMSPDTFIQKPVRWLRAISRFRATTSGAPNFAYDLCTRKVSDAHLETLGLSSWTIAFNGSEPVRADTLEAFSRKFERCGFRHSTFYPCYGLAEATLFVTGGITKDPPVILEVDAEALKANTIKLVSAESREGARALVGCGRVVSCEEVLIVDPQTCCPVESDASVGEIWVKGPHVSRGYLNRPEITAQTFAARLASGGGPYLRTGDLGFMRRGELYVVGRIKDLIIVNGRNYYPHDIEQSLRGLHWAFRDASAAAFAVEVDGTTKVGLLQEIDRKFNHVLVSGDPAVLLEMQRSVRRIVAADHGVTIHGCMFVAHGGIPKTTSGKTRRNACAEIYNGWLQAGSVDAPVVELQQEQAIYMSKHAVN